MNSNFEQARILMVKNQLRPNKIKKKDKEHVEKNLLHFYNLIDEKKGYLILTALNSPKFWKINLPDLKSRILSSIIVKINKLNSTILK